MDFISKNLKHKLKQLMLFIDFMIYYLNYHHIFKYTYFNTTKYKQQLLLMV